jgi:hypothetical protein
MRADGCWPSVLGKDQIGSCLILQLSNPSFGYAVLKVSVHTTERDRLAALDNLLHEEILSEAAVVSMIMEDLDSMRAGKPFECALGFNRLLP